MIRVRAAAWPVVLIALLAVGLPVLDAALAGAYDIPRNDDWAFSRIAAELYDHGRLRLLDWNEMTLLGLFAWSAPFAAVLGSGLEALRASTALAAAVCLGATWVLARRRLTPDRAVVAVLAVAVMAPFTVLVTEYLTDLPALALALLCVVAGGAALDAGGRRRTALLAVALGLGAWAFTIRDTALAAPLGVLAGVALQDGRAGRGLRAAATGAVALLVPCAAFWAWRHTLADGGGAPSEPAVFLGSAMRVGQVLTTLAALAAPALLGSLPALLRRGRPAWAGMAAGLAVVVFVLVAEHHYDEPQSLLAGNALLRAGELGNDALAGSRPDAMPALLWDAVQALAAAGSAVLGGWAIAGAAALRRSGRAALQPEDLALAVAAGLPLLAVLVRAGDNGAVFDRYLLLPAIAVTLAALRAAPPSRSGGVLVTPALSILAAATALLVLNAHAFAAARWHAGERAAAAGVAATDVDAGFEWTAAHHPGPALSPAGAPVAGAPDPGYHADFPGSGNCVVVAASGVRDPALRPAGTVAWTPWPGHRSRLRLYRNPGRCR